MYDVVDHIPVPAEPTDGPGRRPSYPFAVMRVGSSFGASGDEAAKIGSAAKIWKRRHPGWNYVTRKEGDAFRIWRTA